jgi:hypothetical protein
MVFWNPVRHSRESVNPEPRHWRNHDNADVAIVLSEGERLSEVTSPSRESASVRMNWLARMPLPGFGQLRYDTLEIVSSDRLDAAS